MNQEDRQLLLKDLCARLPYKVKIELTWWVMGEGTCINTTLEPDIIEQLLNDEDGDTEIKPYLRPLSSMTEKEKKKFDDFCVIDEFVFKGDTEIGHKNQAIIMSEGIDYLNSIHVDYRGLIPKGLAIEVTKENNPYEDINFQ